MRTDDECNGWSNVETWRVAMFIDDSFDEEMGQIAQRVDEEELGTEERVEELQDKALALLMSWKETYVEAHYEATVRDGGRHYLSLAHEAFTDWLSDVNFEQIAEAICADATSEASR